MESHITLLLLLLLFVLLANYGLSVPAAFAANSSSTEWLPRRQASGHLHTHTHTNIHTRISGTRVPASASPYISACNRRTLILIKWMLGGETLLVIVVIAFCTNFCFSSLSLMSA